MGMNLGDAMSQAWNQSWDMFGQKAGQFGNWVGDVTGLNGAKAPEMRAVDFGQANEARAQQQALLQQLQQQYSAMAAGNGPSLAQGQLQQATDQNIANAMALGAAQQGQGLGYASALRGIADQSAAARQQQAAQSALIRNAEQMQAMQGLGGIAGALGGMRGQDLGQAGLGADQGYRYDALRAGIEGQNAAARRGIVGGLANAGGAILGGAVGGPAGAMAGGQAGSALFGGGGQQTGLRFDPNTTPMLSRGGRVPGYARGGPMDSRSHDTVPAMLSPGEVVLPRSITMAPDAPERAAAFVKAIQARQKSRPQSGEHPMRRAA